MGRVCVSTSLDMSGQGVAQDFFEATLPEPLMSSPSTSLGMNFRPEWSEVETRSQPLTLRNAP